MIHGEFDYIIVGAGSAGCVLAHRLSEDPSISVLLVESGPRDNSIFLKMPTAFAHAIESGKYDWHYVGEPEPYLDGRQLACPRGKVLGGSSSINAMCFVRGHPLDFDGWANETGYPHWSFQHCLPYFKKMETFDGGESMYRGGNGPLSVISPTFSNPLCDVFAQAGVERGYAWTEDANGQVMEGFGSMDQTILAGKRESAASAYLEPIRQRRNLKIVTGALVRKITVVDKRATGIVLNARNGKQIISSNKETIICAGTINSPKLLMLSGIGPADHLQQFDIDINVDLPGVGQNLQDHVNVNVMYESLQPITATNALKPLYKAWLGAQWLITKKGLGATNHFEVAGYIKSSEAVAYADLQLLFIPLLVDDTGKAPEQPHGFQVALSQLRSKSRGNIRLRSADPETAPSILFNYLQSPDDLNELREGIRKTRALFQADAFKPYLGKELAPGADVADDAALNAFINKTLRSTKHPVGTCKMGSDNDAVVDDQGRVHGITALRVVDASIMPLITSGNTNAPTMMLAERIADNIVGKTPLAAIDLESIK